jgi:chromosomal replication initiator protein
LDSTKIQEGSAEKVWEDCLQYISPRVKTQTFHTWFQPVRALRIENRTLVLEVANQFAIDWVSEHFAALINEALNEVVGDDATFELCTRSKTSQPADLVATDGGLKPEGKPEAPVENPAPTLFATPQPSAPNPNNSNGTTNGSPAVGHAPTYPIQPRQIRRPGVGLALSDRYMFDTFVVGESNQFAHAAALSVAESGGSSRFNPLYIYGKVGLGKTHLAQAIGHLVLELAPRARVVYATSEKFTNDFINSLSAGNTAEFTQRYRSVDLLIVDDIQFFAGKESTQAQFFHTFNDLYQNGRRIVLTSDRPPREIKGLEERLLSRFGWGLVTDIQPPDLETRIAILKKKTENEQIVVPEEVLEHIALHITTNIRDLEGSLIRLLAYASLFARDVTLELTREVLQDTLKNHRQPITIEAIQKAVAAHFNLSLDSMSTKKKTQEIVTARQIAMYVARELTGSPLKSIGARFGGRDHSTVIHACTQVSSRAKEDPTFKQHIDQIVNNLYS